MAYIVSLKQFDGPLDLLLTLIGDAKLDINEIAISEVTGQYMEKMALTDELDMEQASEFLQMAATLLEIKSRRMLPKPPPPEEEGALTPEEILVRQLEEYRLFKSLTQRLQEKEVSAQSLLTKLPEELPLPPQEIIITGVTLERLTAAFKKAIERFEREHAAQRQGHSVRHDAYTVAECMTRLVRLLWIGKNSFTAVLEDADSKEEIICLFLALLELVKTGRVQIDQTEQRGDIRMTYIKKDKTGNKDTEKEATENRSETSSEGKGEVQS